MKKFYRVDSMISATHPKSLVTITAQLGIERFGSRWTAGEKQIFFDEIIDKPGMRHRWAKSQIRSGEKMFQNEDIILWGMRLYGPSETNPVLNKRE